MTKEELEKEAIKCMHEIKYWLRVPIRKETEKDGISEILKLTEPREKRIAELEAQIEKMKNCFNCAKGDWNNRVKCIKSGCVNKDKWEIKENE